MKANKHGFDKDGQVNGITECFPVPTVDENGLIKCTDGKTPLKTCTNGWKEDGSNASQFFSQDANDAWNSAQLNAGWHQALTALKMMSDSAAHLNLIVEGFDKLDHVSSGGDASKYAASETAKAIKLLSESNDAAIVGTGD